MPRPKYWKVGPEDLARFPVERAWEANAMKNALTAGGIQATIEGEFQPYGVAVSPIWVVVRKWDLLKAQGILEELRTNPPGPAPDVKPGS